MKLVHIVIGGAGALLASLHPVAQTSGHVCPPRTTLACTSDDGPVSCACWADRDTRADLVAIASSPGYCERNVTSEAQMLYVRVRNIGLSRAARSATAVNFGPLMVIANTPALEPQQEVAVSVPMPEKLRAANALGSFSILVDYDDAVFEPPSSNVFQGLCRVEEERLSTDD